MQLVRDDTDVTSVGRVALGPHDLLVVGELDVDLLVRDGRRFRHVVLNQSGHLTWQHSPEQVSGHYHSNRGPRAVVTVSRHVHDLVRFAFPETEVIRVRPSIDTGLFRPGPSAQRRVTLMPRRGGADLETVLRILGPTGALEGWQVCPLVGLTHAQTADELRRSQVFLTASTQEGFGYARCRGDGGR